MIVAIIGMHRSGTSLAARLLNIAGLYLGRQEEMIEAGPNNPSGFWEHRRLLTTNDRLLAHFDGTWLAPPTLPDHWVTEVRDEPIWAEAMAALRESFCGRGDWGWKDPRTTLTLPFWRRAIVEAGLAGPGAADVRAVICVRNPLDVAASLEAAGARGGSHIPAAQGLAVWQHYTLSALRNTRPDERVVVFYEDLLQDPCRALGRALALSGLQPLAADDPRAENMRQFVQGELRHHSHSLEDVLDGAEVPDHVKGFYEALRRDPEEATALASGPLGRQWDAAIQLQFRAYEIERLRGILNSPPHRAVDLMSRQVRRLPAVRSAVTALLHAAVGRASADGGAR